MDENVAAQGEKDVPEMLEQAANQIDVLESQLHVANAQLEVMQFVRMLVGMRGVAMGPVGVDMVETFADRLRQRARNIKRVTR